MQRHDTNNLSRDQAAVFSGELFVHGFIFHAISFLPLANGASASI
jgi:hypothetical protein